jgi:hypothetical protein
METKDTNHGMPAVHLPVRLVADLQDSLLIVVHDLGRLDRLLADAADTLMSRFLSVSENLEAPASGQLLAVDGVRGALQAAVIELQFQDMASQLIGHTSKTLQGCAYRLACESMSPEDGDAVPFVDGVPDRPNPVTQDEMDAGSIELF